MAKVEVEFAPKGGAEVKKTAKEIADAFAAAQKSTIDAGKSPLFVNLKTARDLVAGFNGDLRKTLEFLSKNGVASKDIVLLMTQLTRESKEARKDILGISQATDEVVRKIKAATVESDGFNVKLATARTFAKSFNWDLEKTAQHLRSSGASTNSIKVAMAALKVEATAVKNETKSSSEHADEFTKNLKNGAFAAGLVQKALQAAKKTLGDLNDLAGVDNGKDATKKALSQDAKFNKLEKELKIFDDPEQSKQLRQNILKASKVSNIPIDQLLDTTLGIQEAKSAGREYALDNGGAGLMQLAKMSYGDFQTAEESVGSSTANVISAKDLNIPADQVALMNHIITAGEDVGSLTGKDIKTKGGATIAQLGGLRKKTGIAALREGSALLQSLGNVPGLSGNIDAVKVVAEDMIGKLTDVKTRDRLKDDTKIETFNKDGTMRALPDILTDIRAFRNAKPENEQKLYEIFREKQSRKGILGLTSGDNIEKLKSYENANSDEGGDILFKGYQKRVNSTEGQLDSQHRQREADELNKLPSRAKKIVQFGRLSQESQESPLIAGVTQGVADLLAEKGGAKGMMLGAAVLSAGVALSSLASNNPKDPFKYQVAQGAAAQDLQALPATKEMSANDDKTKAIIGSIVTEAAKAGVRLDLGGEDAPMGKRGMKVEVEIKVDQDGKVSEVTSASKDTKTAAKGNTRKKTTTQR